MDQNKKSIINGDSPSTSSSFSKKITSSLAKVCCFRRKNTRQRPETAASGSRSGSSGRGGWSLRSPTAWASERLPEIKYKYRRYMDGRRLRRHSADFRYDILSYSKNFDDGDLDSEDRITAMARFRSLSSRAPYSQRPPAAAVDDVESESSPDSVSTSTTTATSEMVLANGR